VIVPFSQKGSRPELNSNNLYIKNIPNLPENTVQTKLASVCKSFGEVVSLFVKVDKTSGLPFAFVCFKNNSEANLAYKQLANADPFAYGTNLYVNWA
jgi:RNA recognition motif-containing protein